MKERIMIVLFWILGTAVMTLLCLALGGCARVATVYDYGVPNLHEVSPGLWRSGQPTTVEQWRYLESIGVRYELKLNDFQEGDDSPAFSTQVQVIYNSMQPVGDANIIDALTNTFRAPTHEQIADALSAIRAHKGQGVLVHCTHGQDRTGLIIGLYRVLDEGWAADVAYNEMLALGFHPELHGLHEYWEKFAAEHK